MRASIAASMNGLTAMALDGIATASASHKRGVYWLLVRMCRAKNEDHVIKSASALWA